MLFIAYVIAAWGLVVSAASLVLGGELTRPPAFIAIALMMSFAVAAVWFVMRKWSFEAPGVLARQRGGMFAIAMLGIGMTATDNESIVGLLAMLGIAALALALFREHDPGDWKGETKRIAWTSVGFVLVLGSVLIPARIFITQDIALADGASSFILAGSVLSWCAGAGILWIIRTGDRLWQASRTTSYHGA